MAGLLEPKFPPPVLEIKRRMHMEKFYSWLAYRLPKRLVYFASIRLMSHATVGQYGNTIVPELTAMDALDRWK